MSTLWADDLKTEYETGRKAVTQYKNNLDRDDPSNENYLTLANSMIAGSKEVEEWLMSGRDPRTFKGIDKKSIYNKNSFDTLEGMDLIPDITERLRNQPHRDLSMTAEMESKLVDILWTLSPRERQCYIMQKSQGMTAAQIGEELGVGIWSVYEYLKRANKKIKKIL